MLSKGLAALAILVGFASGQTFNGRITGTITDAAGGLVPGATVTAKQVDTNVEKKTTTAGSGSYDIPSFCLEPMRSAWKRQDCKARYVET